VRLALDTNVLVYAEGLNLAPSDAHKHRLAVRLMGRMADETTVLARQSLAELHRVLVRKARLTSSEASIRVSLWALKADLVDTNAAVFNAALALATDHGLPIFDALILAAAVEARCDLLLSEDFHDGFAWRGIVVTNPFGPTPDRRLARLLAD
jgi:predicted nucleic acid-binding protein